jgi:pimeloyl-ACP methyl ester carboxylesterase
MEPRAHAWVANGLSHNVLEWNRGGATSSGPTALVIHGFADAAATWDEVAGVLADAGLRVLAPDMRGFGDGPRIPPGAYYYFPDYVADVAALVREHLAPDAPLFVVGHSMGATIAAYYAATLPERVAKVALVDGLGPPDNPPEVAPVRMRTWIEGVERLRASASATRSAPFASIDEAGARLAKYNPDIDLAVLRRRATQLVRAEAGGFAWKHDPLHTTTSPMPFFAASYRAFLGRITCPALYVSGGSRGFHTPDQDERLASFTASPGLTQVTIDAGHALHWARPKELGDALVRFWRA